MGKERQEEKNAFIKLRCKKAYEIKFMMLEVCCSFYKPNRKIEKMIAKRYFNKYVMYLII